jgi:voltage-gated potassium channel
MMGEELRRLSTWSERHRRLLARILIALALTVAVDLIGALLAWQLEAGAKGSDIHGFGDALFFTTVQLLTISSQMKNPVTAAGRVLDVLLEAWAIFVLTAVAGSFAAFFQTGDSS